MTDFIGIDIGDKVNFVCILNNKGEILFRKEIENNKEAMEEYFDSIEKASIVFEVGSHSPWISRLLVGIGHDVFICNPRQLAAVSQNLKKSDEEIDFTTLRILPEWLARVVEMMKNDEISSTNAQEVVRILLEIGGNPDEIVEKKWLKQVNDTGLMETIVEKVLAESVVQIAEYQSGKPNLFGYFVGQCMKESKWAGNPKMFTDLIKKRIG